MVVFAAGAVLLLAMLQPAVQEPESIPDRPAEISGVVAAMQAQDGVVHLGVESFPAYRRVFRQLIGWLEVGNQTTILRQAGGGAADEVTVEEIHKGSQVKVWLTGSVLLTYPCQAEAEVILIVGEIQGQSRW